MSSTISTRHGAHGAAGSRRPPEPPRGRWATFVRRYGWRAYALPALSVITVVALARPDSSPPARHTAAHLPASPAAASPAAASPAAGSSADGKSPGEQVEGRTAGDAGFAAGSTPAPVVVDLGDDAISCATNTHPKLLLVSLSTQHLWACAGGKQVRSTPVTTGATAHNDQTPKGSWLVQAKERDRYLVGAGYRDYVHYWVPFNGDFGLHDASWQTMPFGSADFATRGSHGCVHVPTATMAWLYQWSQVGDTVVTVES